jgi:hypothetical protein
MVAAAVLLKNAVLMALWQLWHRSSEGILAMLKLWRC